jgi:hypothetical protein
MLALGRQHEVGLLLGARLPRSTSWATTGERLPLSIALADRSNPPRGDAVDPSESVDRGPFRGSRDAQSVHQLVDIPRSQPPDRRLRGF